MALNANVRLIHVPYKGTGPALMDVIGGQVTMMFGQMSSVLPQIKSGKLRAIGVASLKRSAVLPDVPTIAEAGHAELRGGVVVRADGAGRHAQGHRRQAQRRKPQDARQAGDPGEVRGPRASSPAAARRRRCAATIQTETVRWADGIQKKNIKAE